MYGLGHGESGEEKSCEWGHLSPREESKESRIECECSKRKIMRERERDGGR